MTDQEERNESRTQMVSKVGGFGVAMLAICIPLSAIIGDYSHLLAALLPLAVIAGTSVSMVTIWLTSSRKANSREIEELKQQVADLHARLSNLEMMDSYERRLAQREAQAQIQQAPPATPTYSTIMPDVIQPTQPRTERQA